MTLDEMIQINLDHLFKFLSPEERQEFEVAFAQALLSGKHFINNEHSGLHLEPEHPMPAEEIINTLLEWEFTPQGASYWGGIFERLGRRPCQRLESNPS